MNLIKNKNILSENRLEHLLIILLPFFAIFSIFLLEVALILVSVGFIIKNLKNFEKEFFLNQFCFLFLIFYIYLLVRYFISDTYESQSYLFVIFYFRYGLYVISVYYFLSKISKLQNNFLKSIVLCAIILIIDGFIQFIIGKNIIGYQIIDNNRVSSFFGDESILGSYMIKIIPFLFLYMLQKISLKRQIFVFSIVILGIVLIFLSGERASAALSILMILYLFVTMKELRIPTLISIFISFSLIILIFINSENTKGRYVKTIQELFKSDLNQSNLDQQDIDRVNNEILDKKITDGKLYIVSATHNNYFITSLKMFDENKLFGHGPKSFRVLCNDDKFKINIWSCSTHPHNYYIQLLAEYGIIGFLFPFLLFLYFIYKSIKGLFKDVSFKIENIFYCFFIINLWPLTTTGNFFNNWISILVYLPFSFYLFNLKVNDK